MLIKGGIAFLSVNAVAIAFYFLGGQFRPGFSRDPADWAAFGSYLGGVAGPIATLAGLVPLLVTISQQELAAQQLFLRDYRDRIRQAVNENRSELRRLMHRRIDTGADAKPLFEDFVDGAEASFALDQVAWRIRVRRMLKLAVEYAKNLNVYVDNVRAPFELRSHIVELQRILKFLDTQRSIFRPNEMIALDFAFKHLSEIELG
jgi:hypothetical protein